jgi:hypothetical protein
MLVRFQSRWLGRKRAKPVTRRSRSRFCAEYLSLEQRTLMALAIQIDYSLDSNNFFSTQTKRDLLQLAANTIAAQVNTNLAAIVPGGVNTWAATFQSPSTGTSLIVTNLTIPANTIVIYVGGRNLSGSEAGFAGPGGFNATGTANWLDTVQARGQAGGLTTPPTQFGPWGGSIAFDNTNTNWYFGALTPVPSNQIDFLSVAMHEIGHVLGVGDIPPAGQPVTAWSRLDVGGSFVGAAAEAAHGGAAVPLDSGGNHWARGTMSDGQEAAMTPILLQGTRKLFTTLDYSGLIDLGWQVTLPTNQSSLQFSTSATSVGQNAGSLLVTVTRTGVTSSGASVQIAATDGTAHSGLDYSITPGILAFNAGATTASFVVQIFPDVAANNDVSFIISLSNPSTGAVIGSPSSILVTITHAHAPVPETKPDDFNGAGKTDVSLFRPTTSQWLVSLSPSNAFAVQFGQPGDIPLQGDFDRSGRQEFAFYRPSTAQWFIVESTGLKVIPFGEPNVDIPVPADYDGDGKTDIAVYRPTTAEWFIMQSTAGPRYMAFGQPNVDLPVPADYDGDGRADIAVYRPTTAQWLLNQSSNGLKAVSFGQAGVDRPIPADYDGVGHAEIAVYRPTTAQWFIISATNGPEAFSFGEAQVDIPVPADYDGDGKVDFAVYRPTTAEWFILQSTAGPRHQVFGQANVDVPLPTPLSYRYSGGLTGRSERVSQGSADVAATTAIAPPETNVTKSAENPREHPRGPHVHLFHRRARAIYVG